MSYGMDLHLHSFYSDGTRSPHEVAKWAKEQGAVFVSLTDHDGVDGLPEFFAAANELGLVAIPGIEISSEDSFVPRKDVEVKLEIHVLGYNFDYKDKDFLSKLQLMRERRIARNEKVVAALREMGYYINVEGLLSERSNGYIGKPQFADLLVRAGYISHPKEAFAIGKFFDAEPLKSIKKVKVGVEDAINMINAAGGIAVLAHPIQLYGLREFGGSADEIFFSRIDKLLCKYKSLGLGGLECFHPDHSMADSGQFVARARNYGLMITGGSDFHGPEFL